MASPSGLQQQRSSSSRWGSPHRTVVWTEPKSRSSSKKKKVAVVYYLCRQDGQLEHPHFMEVISSSGLVRLRDFTERLDALRGSGMASMYSWSCKRSYRNGFVWHDLAEDDDLIHPGNDEYVLKGCQLLRPCHQQQPPMRDASASSSSSSSKETSRAGRRKKWSSFDDLRSTDAATQTDDRGREPTELAIDEISPPPSSSSPDDTLLETTLIGNGGRMLMQLFSCGSIAAVGNTKRQNCRGTSHHHHKLHQADMAMDRDYFSGSLVMETKSTAPALSLRRSSSYNAAHSRKAEEGRATATSKCIPPRTAAATSSSGT